MDGIRRLFRVKYLKMLAKKLGCLAIALVAEICAAGGPNFLTICIHQDGSVRYEPTMALCCRQDAKGQGECCSAGHADHGSADGVESDDPCEDYGVAFSQISVSRPSLKRVLSDGPVTVLFPLLIVLPDSPVTPEASDFAAWRPPRDRILHDLSTIVLRI